MDSDTVKDHLFIHYFFDLLAELDEVFSLVSRIYKRLWEWVQSHTTAFPRRRLCEAKLPAIEITSLEDPASASADWIQIGQTRLTPRLNKGWWGVFWGSAWSLLLAVHPRTLDRRLLCTVIHQASTVSLALTDSHLTEVSLHIYHATQHPLILNYPWLVLHSPHIDWSTGMFSSWSELWPTLHLYLETVSSKLTSEVSEFILSSEQ